MQYVDTDLQAIFQKVASCHELGIPFKLESGFHTKKTVLGFNVEKESYVPCFVLTLNEQEGSVQKDEEPDLQGGSCPSSNKKPL